MPLSALSAGLRRSICASTHLYSGGSDPDREFPARLTFSRSLQAERLAGRAPPRRVSSRSSWRRRSSALAAEQRRRVSALRQGLKHPAGARGPGRGICTHTAQAADIGTTFAAAP